MTTPAESIIDIVNHTRPKEHQEFLDRIKEGSLTRDENRETHFCCFFAAIDPSCREVFLGLHKKACLWLFNGGHMDQGELPEQSVRREMLEEWGYDPVSSLKLTPRLMTITHINSQVVVCKTHHDIWYFIPVQKLTFHPNQNLLATEFHQTKWLPLAESYQIVSDLNTRTALDFINQNYCL